MAGAPPVELRERPAGLTHVGSYRRELPVSLERMYENALDWEHLPWLHSSSFSDVECLEAGDWGWRARVVGSEASGGGEIRLELLLDESQGRWISRVLEGATTGSEIWTYATELAPHRIVVEIDFYFPDITDPDMSAMLGDTMRQLYAQLYDEDEWMMVERQKALDKYKGVRPRSEEALDLGPANELRARLPLQVEFDGRPYKIVELDGELVVYCTVCPHVLAPLDDVEVDDGCVVCPWHGYRFDVRTRACTNQDRYRLLPSPTLHTDPTTSRANLSWA